MPSEQIQYEGKDLESMSFAQNYHRWIVSIFRKYLGKRVAEVGAGSGNFSSLLASENIQELVAIEPSQEMFPLLREKFRNTPRVVCAQALFADIYTHYTEHFDSIVYVNVLEHIEHDAIELHYVHQSLKQGGYVCIFVPALPWLYSVFDASLGHYRRYEKKQLEKLLENAGFVIVKISFFDFFGIIPWFVACTLFRRKLSAGNTAAYDTIVVPFSRVFEFLIPVPLGKNLIAVGKKK